MMATIRIPKSKRSEYVTMTSPPLRCSGGGKKFRPPPERGASRLPNTGSASAYPCAGDIIARFVEFGKIRGYGLPRQGCALPRNDNVLDPLRGGQGHGVADAGDGRCGDHPPD